MTLSEARKDIRHTLQNGWIVLGLVFVAVGLRVVSVRPLQRVMRVYAVSSVVLWQRIEPSGVGQRIRHVSRWLPVVACLERALVCYAILDAHGIESHLHLGVNKSASEQIAAHAWATVDGRVVIGELDNLTEYTKLPVDQWQ